jgi:thiol:disulfide interchange protein DsbD
MVKGIMFNGERKSFLRALLFLWLLLLALMVGGASSRVCSAQGLAILSSVASQSPEGNASLHGVVTAQSRHTPDARDGESRKNAQRRDLLLRVQSDSDAQKSPQQASTRPSIWFALLAVFLGGLALNLTPCIYPLIPITISYFGGKSERMRGQIIIHGILYMLGLAVTNSLLGLSAALSGEMLGYALQNPLVLVFVAAVMVAMGLSFFGLWELRLPLWLTRVASKSYAGLFGTFFMGLTLGIVAAPCLGPFILGLLLYVGQVGDPLQGFLFFFVLSIGLGLPLSLLAVFSGAVARLPKSGDWMVWIRKLMGWVLMGMAAFMIGPVVSHVFSKALLLAGISVAAGIHLGVLDKTGKGRKVFSVLKKAASMAIAFGGIAYLILASQPVKKIEWISYDPAVMAKAKEEGKPVILEFYADWCGPCHMMEREVFVDPAVVKATRHFTTVRADLTRVQSFHDELLARYQIRGIPAVVFINGEGNEETELRVVGVVDKSEFLKRLEAFQNKSFSSQK